MKLELVNGVPVIFLDQFSDTHDMLKALDRATKWSESVPGSVQRLYYDLLALEAQKIVADPNT